MGKYVGKNALTAFWNGIKAKFSDVAFSGDYDDLINKPTLGTASSKNVSSSGDASSSQVVMGNDSRLTDARPASDVSSWAKQSTKPTYTKSEVGLGDVGNFKAVSTVANQGLTDTEKRNARTNIGAGTSSLALGETATTAAKGNHTHSLSMAADTGTSSVSLSANSKYKLTAGGSTYVFTTPKDTTYSSKNAASGGTDVSLVTTGEKYTWNKKSNLALGETSSTAYRGDRGKTAYDHSQSNHSSIAPAFTEASTRANIATGESLATMFGKIKKFFTDLKKVAFTGSYSDLSDTPTIPAKALWVDMGTISSLPVTKSVTGCQTDMVVAKAELGTPSAQTGNWTFNTDTAGKVTLSGTISGSTTLKILLVQEVSVTAT